MIIGPVTNSFFKLSSHGKAAAFVDLVQLFTQVQVLVNKLQFHCSDTLHSTNRNRHVGLNDGVRIASVSGVAYRTHHFCHICAKLGQQLLANVTKTVLTKHAIHRGLLASHSVFAAAIAYFKPHLGSSRR